MQTVYSAEHLDVIAIKNLMNRVIDGFNSMQLESLLELHNDQVILMEPNMPVIQGKEEVRRLFRKLEEKRFLLNLQHRVEEVEVCGTLGFARGQLTKTSVSVEGILQQESAKFICLFKKQADGRWLRTHVMVNSNDPVKADPVAEAMR